MSLTHVTVVNESDSDCDTDSLAHLADFLMSELRLHPDTELGITLVGLERMSDLHEQWMSEPGPTDVLSFPMDELREPASGLAEAGMQPGILGDIVLCPAYLGPQADAAGRSLDEELQFLVTHGVLHLLGHDHVTQNDYDVMFARQDALLAAWASQREPGSAAR